MAETKTGWGNPSPSALGERFHYFQEGGLALCGQWGVGHVRSLEEGRDDHPDNCPACVKKMKTNKEKEEEERCRMSLNAVE